MSSVLATLAAATTGPAVTESKADASTWIFLAVLAGATAFVLAGWWRTAERWQPPTIRGVYRANGSWVGAFSGAVAASSGMKVLGHLDHPNLRAIAALRRDPDGLDELVGGTHPLPEVPF